MNILCALLVILFVNTLNAAQPEATSLLGKPLTAPELSDKTKAEYEKNLAIAKENYKQGPGIADNIIWLGRRTAYLGQYREAIKIFSEGIQKHPGDARMYRHRGHRYLTVREIDKAILDLEQAASLIFTTEDEVEPDGLPNPKNIPTSTLHSNIWYHLGLAYYLKGNFSEALEAFTNCMDVSKNNDNAVATAHWLYMTLRRLGRHDEAKQIAGAISKEMEIIENHDYHTLLMMYKGAIDPESLLKKEGDDLSNATIGYGVGNWYLYNGKKERAIEIFNKVIKGKMWPAFGYLAAEAELNRLSK
jgi:tetratricopeptide (TPR) repeat protein